MRNRSPGGGGPSCGSPRRHRRPPRPGTRRHPRAGGERPPPRALPPQRVAGPGPAGGRCHRHLRKHQRVHREISPLRCRPGKSRRRLPPHRPPPSSLRRHRKRPAVTGGRSAARPGLAHPAGFAFPEGGKKIAGVLGEEGSGWRNMEYPAAGLLGPNGAAKRGGGVVGGEG